MNMIRYNLNMMMRKKTFKFSFGLVMMLCILLPFFFAIKYKGYPVYQLPAAYTLYVGNELGLAWKYVRILFPFLVILPYSMCFFEESKEGTILYIQSRCGRKKYYGSQMITCFIGGFILIGIPFLINILLNAIIFPANANDYISTYDMFTENWSGSITGSNIIFPVISKGYILKGLFINHPQIHNLLFAVLAGIVAGIMSMLAYAFSIFITKSRLFIFFLMYIFFQAFSMIDSVLFDAWDVGITYVCTNITAYISNGLLQVGRVYWLFYIFLVVVVLFIVRTVKRRIKSDEI